MPGTALPETMEDARPSSLAVVLCIIYRPRLPESLPGGMFDAAACDERLISYRHAMLDLTLGANDCAKPSLSPYISLDTVDSLSLSAPPEEVLAFFYLPYFSRYLNPHSWKNAFPSPDHLDNPFPNVKSRYGTFQASKVVSSAWVSAALLPLMLNFAFCTVVRTQQPNGEVGS